MNKIFHYLSWLCLIITILILFEAGTMLYNLRDATSIHLFKDDIYNYWRYDIRLRTYERQPNVVISQKVINKLNKIYNNLSYETMTCLDYKKINDTYYVNNILPEIKIVQTPTQSSSQCLAWTYTKIHNHPRTKGYLPTPSEVDISNLVLDNIPFALIQGDYYIVGYDKYGNIFEVKNETSL